MYAFRTRFPDLSIWGFAALVVLGLIFLSWLAGCNGLIGLASHNLLQGVAAGSATGNDAGYLLVAAVLQYVIGDTLWALRILTWLAVLFSVYLFNGNLSELMPGGRPHVRWLYMLVFLVLAPAYMLAGSRVAGDAFGLMVLMAAIWPAMRLMQQMRLAAAVALGLLSGLYIGAGSEMTMLLLPLLTFVAVRIAGLRRWRLVWVLGCSSLAGLSVAWWLGAGIGGNMQALFQDWSVRHFFQDEGFGLNGAQEYGWPNFLYLGFPFFHPAFCLLLPGLAFFMFRTDWWLPSRSVLSGSLLLYLFYLAGMPGHALQWMLPAYVVLLLLLFPAWDRLVSYGEFFFPRMLAGILTALLLTQLILSGLLLYPLWRNNQIEQVLAVELQEILPQTAVVYGDEIGTAMRTYLPEQEWRALEQQPVDALPAGAYLVADTAYRDLPWASLRSLSGGHILYQIPVSR